MVLRYTVIDPTKNITLLVTTPVQRALQAQTAAWLLRREKDAEQVGFLEPSDTAPARLQMMGDTLPDKDPAARNDIVEQPVLPHRRSVAVQRGAVLITELHRVDSGIAFIDNDLGMHHTLISLREHYTTKW